MSDFDDGHIYSNQYGWITLSGWANKIEGEVRDLKEEIEELKKMLNPCVGDENDDGNKEYLDFLSRLGVIKQAEMRNDAMEEREKNEECRGRYA